MNPERRERPREFTVRMADAQDAPGIARIQHESWLSTYPNEETGISREDIELYLGDIDIRTQSRLGDIEKMHTDKMRVFVIESEGKIIGYCKVRKEEVENFIDALYLDPAQKGVGAGGKLMTDALHWLGSDKAIELEVATYNAHAIAFYERYGFHETGEMGQSVSLNEGKRINTVRMIKEGSAQV